MYVCVGNSVWVFVCLQVCVSMYYNPLQTQGNPICRQPVSILDPTLTETGQSYASHRTGQQSVRKRGEVGGGNGDTGKRFPIPFPYLFYILLNAFSAYPYFY